MSEQNDSSRNLTDEDAEAVAAALEARLVKHFYVNLGQGVWGIFWKAVVGVIIIISAYGAVKGHG